MTVLSLTAGPHCDKECVTGGPEPVRSTIACSSSSMPSKMPGWPQPKWLLHIDDDELLHLGDGVTLRQLFSSVPREMLWLDFRSN